MSEIRKTGIKNIELGSTHIWDESIETNIPKLRKMNVLIHNFFPPSKDLEQVLNIASLNKKILEASKKHIKTCIDFASSINAKLYTIHPGFLADVVSSTQKKNQLSGYDFIFSRDRSDYEEAFSIMLESLCELVEYAKNKQVNLAIETEGSMTNPDVLLMQHPDEYDRLFKQAPLGLGINFNLAHSFFSSKKNKFSLKNFISKFADRFSAIELSHNEGFKDDHSPLVKGSFVFDWLELLPENIPLVLEFRDSTIDKLNDSRDLLLKIS